MNYFLDTEFIEGGRTIDLISVGIVSENGYEFYAQVKNTTWNVEKNVWVAEHVVPHLVHMECRWNRQCHDVLCPWLWLADLGDGIQGFLAYDVAPVFWGYYCAYDWVVICQLFGSMMMLPSTWPMYCRDLRQALDERGLQEVRQSDAAPHHALQDAKWIAQTWREYVALKNSISPSGSG